MSHPLRRLKERYGLEATESDLGYAAKQVRKGWSVLLGRYRGGERHLVEIRGRAVVVAVRRGWITTVLPPCYRHRAGRS